MKTILWFSEISKKDVPKVGGKGANLGEMISAGLPVPDGFCVTAEAYFHFLDKTGTKEKIKKVLSGLDVEDSKDLAAASKKVKKAILKAKMPKEIVEEIKKAYRKLARKEKLFVAVRSSATAEDLPEASFAGQQATYLNVCGEKEVVSAVQKCWASLFEARAIYYRQTKGFDHFKVGIAVPIQKMVQSEKAGVMFTVNPVDNDRSKILIEAGFGLGEAVVSGAITPDRYLVDKKTFKILEKEVSPQEWKIAKVGKENKHVTISRQEQEKQVLDDKEIVKLAKLGAKIEKHYDFPQDAEWTAEGGKIYIVQTRPVTTLKKQGISDKKQGAKEEKGKKLEDMKVILKGLGASVGMNSGPVKVIHSADEIDKIKEGDVLVTEMTNPDFVPAMKRATAIVTDTGGRTSHAAIVSRELGIPCVVGTGGATTTLKNSQIITVDGMHGIVYEGKVEAKVEEREEVAASVCEEAPVTGTKIYVNLAEVSRAEEIAKKQVDGVGLLRAEFMIAEIGEHPKAMLESGKGQEFIDKLAEGMKTFAQAFAPRPVIYRATDFKTNEYRNLKGGEKYEPKEDNPMIGFRGCFRYIKDPEVFNLELEAIKKVRVEFRLDNLHLMIPFVRTVEEVVQIKKLLDAAGLQRDNSFKLWLMAEVPSIVFLMEEFCQLGIDGVSIGSNDLTQLILGLDRDSSVMAEEFDERNEAVLKAIEQIITVCKKYNVTVSICGQAPSVYPEITEFLVEKGITSISVNPDVITSTRKLVASVEQKLLLSKIREIEGEEIEEEEEKEK